MFRRRQQDFSAEINAHIALEADRLEADGLSRADAEAAAHRAFGNVTASTELFYESRRWLWWDEIQRDTLYAIRTLLHAPGFATAAILTLALGIGANTAMFSVIDVIALNPLPYAQPDRIVMLYERTDTGDTETLAPADFLDYRRQSRVFTNLTAFRNASFNVAGNDSPERIEGTVVTPDFFGVLGMGAELGRTLNPQQDKPGNPPTVVLSDSLWRRRYAANPQILGRSIEFDGAMRTVVGVMPSAFRFPPKSEAWIPARFAVPEHALRPDLDQSNVRDSHYFHVIGKLKAGVSRQSANAEVDVIATRLKKQFGDTEEAESIAIIPLEQELFGRAKSPAIILLAAVGLLLLIACANVASLVLARGVSRRKEIAIRSALGAGRGRLVRQFLTESLLLSAAGCALGILIAYVLLHPISALLPLQDVTSTSLQIDMRVLAFAIGISALSGLLCGVIPASNVARTATAGSLGDSSRGSSTGVHTNRTRGMLVIGQVALTAILLVGAGLLIRSFDRLQLVPRGFDANGVLTARLSLPAAQYPDDGSRARFVERTIDALSSQPGISSAAAISRLPLLSGNSTRSVDIRGRTPSAGDVSPDYLVATPEYFRTMGIRLLEGRVFTSRDNRKAPSVVIVNAAMARHYWPGQSAVGQAITLGKCGYDGQWCTVVGVVDDVHQQNLGEAAHPAVYVPYAVDPWPLMALTVKTQMQPSQATSSLVSAVHAVDKDLPVYDVHSMKDVVAESFAMRRLCTLFALCFACAAIALAAIGIYGLIAYSVRQRSQEIGIRIALGAARTDIVTMVVRQGLRLGLAGVGIGLLLAAALSRVISAMLFEVRPTDVVTFSASGLLLVAMAALASYVPAWRASRADPATTLRAN